ncbi:MAG: thrombospondin type 3 repeat-containing protein [Candidatus Poseidoniaceae archaeon]|nr:thrombospondin type 3 repeat-containing protein [Candidatus Poseidoniaceae archaeon]
MRRSQTTLLTTLAVIASLLFMSQFPAVSPVSNIHPNDTEGEKPPETDTDKDGIPDVHENLFEEWMNWSTIDGRDVIIPGMDKDNAADALVDVDKDGLNATEEYCWPYPANCTEPGFARGLTGTIDEDGDRQYLDPRVSDTDGDGMPDGFEAYMCARIGGFDHSNLRFDCFRFDPLNSSDFTDDPDDDGFDVNRDGELSLSEMFTSSEEYRFGAPSNYTTELDGLWCSATLPHGSILKSWPYLPSGDNATFHNLLSACTVNATNVVDEDLWLGTDPLLEDSDRYHWDGFSIRRLFPSYGDGMPDGWEAHFGLDPLNRTDALLDPDSDGWDFNRDGVISPDVSRTRTALKIGEELSNFEEYLIHFDNGNTIIPGLKTAYLGAEESTSTQFPLSFTASEEEMSIIHHDITDLDVNGEQLYVTTKYGITVLDYETKTSTDQWMPQGVELFDSIILTEDSIAYAMAIATSVGVVVAPLQVDGGLVELSSWNWEEIGQINSLQQLNIEGTSQQILALGDAGTGNVLEIDNEAKISAVHELGNGIKSALFEANASVSSLAHGSSNGGVQTLYIGTDRGLLISETATARDDSPATWRFFFTPESTGLPAIVDELRSLPLGVIGNPAEVRDIVLDGPSASNSQVLWFGTPAGLHRVDLLTDTITHSGEYQHPGIDGLTIKEANDIYSIYPTGDEILVGSAWGVWAIAGDYSTVYGLQTQERIAGEIVAINILDIDGNNTIFAGASPGQFSNLELIDPGANDSDNDGMPDGWEIAHGLDPTDPWDAHLDTDGDGLDLNQDGFLERLWTNLDEFRYVKTTEKGYNSSNPRVGDSDGDGLPDGAEYFGYYYEQSNLWCHYSVQSEYICGDSAGLSANATYLGLTSSDTGSDPMNWDSDDDGMPDGWEIAHRRWIGTSFTGGNNWTLDPMRPDDAEWDADGDGLANICEYQWSLVRGAAIEGLLLESHGESAESAEQWFIADPNNVDSDGDSLPDGWESKGSCTWDPSRVGINPLNSSDILENPDGDGFDINHDGVLQQNEAFVNWLEFHVRNNLFDGNQTLDGVTLPDGLTTDLFQNINDYGTPEANFGDRASGAITATQSSTILGAADPLSADSDSDGMPDGWEIWYARWDILADEWTLNPLDAADRWQDADEDGMTNWEEYNSIAPQFSETNENRTSPQWFVTTVGSAYALQQWPSILNPESFGSFLTSEQINLTGLTADPNNIDTDGDGMLDGVELLFTSWNTSAQTWTLNPLVDGDGNFDGDGDGLIDKQEFDLVNFNPDNGGNHPFDAPLMHIDGDLHQPTEKAQRVFNILITKETRGKRLLDDFNDWQQGEPPNSFISMLMGITDPTLPDTDDDGMFDGFEYWFTQWDLEENRWSMNPLIDSDVYLDTDDDSFDCDGDGNISTDERFSNLREWESRTWGKYLNRDSVPANTGIIDFGEDAMNAYAEELGFSQYQAQLALYNDFIEKNQESADRMEKLNSLNSDNFNRTLIGVSDPTHPDSDGDGIPDGWEYCYATYGMPGLGTQNHWASNPVNPWDVDYDGDSDGWYNRTAFDTPADQGNWNERVFTPSGVIVQPGIGDLPFTNWMEWDNSTRPDQNDSDGDSITYTTTVVNGLVTSHEQDFNLSDGREVFKYGTNPSDNDSDGDMLPDWYEYNKGWNEDNDNYSTFMQIEVIWIDAITGGVCDTSTLSCLPLSQQGSNGVLGRPDLAFTWFTLDPADPVDANFDPDKDGNWDCSGAGCDYEPYTNFQEFYAITDKDLTSPNAVRLSGMVYQGNPVTEWWQLRGALLHIGLFDESTSNYLKMDQSHGADIRYAYVVDDKDTNFLLLDSSDDEILLAGNRTDQWDIYYTGSPNTSPVRSVGEHELGWYYLDLDNDHISEGSDPMNWDTDGDWMVDWFEVHDDEGDGIRGDSSPIRYDSRQTA